MIKYRICKVQDLYDIKDPRGGSNSTRNITTLYYTCLYPDGNGEVPAEVLLGLDGQRQTLADAHHDPVSRGLLFSQTEVIWKKTITASSHE